MQGLPDDLHVQESGAAQVSTAMLLPSCTTILQVAGTLGKKRERFSFCSN